MIERDTLETYKRFQEQILFLKIFSLIQKISCLLTSRHYRIIYIVNLNALIELRLLMLNICLYLLYCVKRQFWLLINFIHRESRNLALRIVFFFLIQYSFICGMLLSFVIVLLVLLHCVLAFILSFNFSFTSSSICYKYNITHFPYSIICFYFILFRYFSVTLAIR